MKDLRDTLTRRWRQIVYITIAFIAVLIIQDIIREFIVFNQDIDVIEQQLLDKVYDDVKGMVESTEENFMFAIDHLHDNAERHAEDILSDLSFAAESTLTLQPTATQAEIEADIIQLAQLYNDNDQDHAYYVYNLDGTQLLDGSTNLSTSIPMIGAEDDLNRLYVSMLMTEISNSADDEGYISAYITENETLEEYIIYGHLVADTDIVLASYVRYSTFSEKEKERAFFQVRETYANYANTIYILAGDGEILYHQNEQAVGLTVDDDTYPLWQSTLQIIVDYVDENNEGFLEYDFYSNYHNGVISRKVAYVTYVEEWDIIIGASSDEDLYDDILQTYRSDNYRAVLLIKIPAYLLMIAMSIMVYRYVRNNVTRSQRVLEEEKRLYQKFADLTSQIIMIANKQGEIIFTNHLGSEIIYGDRDHHSTIYFDQIMVEEDGYYILYGIKKDMYVKYITEEIEFNDERADLYIISDVTDKITTERKLEALSMRDDLTSLSNRRMMVKDYNEEILPHVKNGGSAHMVMMDLDDFKPANDIYGHSYGDYVLQQIASIFHKLSNKDVRFYRIGGDEFAIMITNMDDEQVKNFLEHLQNMIGEHSYEKDVQVGFSAGVARIEFKEHRRRFSDFYDYADKMLYESKANGKHTITF